MPITGSVSINAKPFEAAVGWAAKWIAAKPAVPIHAGLAVEVTADGIEIRAFDENTAARARCDADGLAGNAKGRAVVSGRLLAELARTFGGKDVVTLTGTPGGIELKAGKFRATLPAFDENDFPALPDALETIGTVGGDAFAEAVRRVTVAAGDDPGKGGMMFVLTYLGFEDEHIQLMATDKYRVAADVVSWRNCATNVPELQSATPLAAVLAAAATAFAGPDDVEIGCDGNSLSLTNPARSLTMRLGDPGENGWPVDTMRRNIALADDYDGEITLDRAALAMPLKRAGFVRGKVGPVKIGIAPGQIEIASQDADLGDQSGNETVAVQYEGEPAGVAFNPQYLAEALSSAPGDTVRMRFQVAGFTRRPVVLSCDADPHWRHVIVPVVDLGKS